MVGGCFSGDKGPRFITPPWTTESVEWQQLDARIATDHPARRIARAVDQLDLSRLWKTYLGVGKKAFPPDLLLKVVLYEMYDQRPSPAHWHRDARDHDALRWLLFGLEPSRARWYDFRDRLAPLWDEWNVQVLHQALAEGLTAATRVAIDSSTIAAHATRRRFLNQERLHQRQQVIEEHLQAQSRRRSLSEAPPGWLAKTKVGLREQKQRYLRAAAVLRQRHEANARRPKAKRRPAERIMVSAADPEAALACDKDGVFRPLYMVQVVRDLDSPLLFAYDVLVQNNDNSVLESLIERMTDAVGLKPRQVLVDSGYVSIRHLQFCHQADITLYGPSQENDFSAVRDKKPQSNQHTELPKSAFTWLTEEQTYQCPEGHRLNFIRTVQQPRLDHKITLALYTCPPEHCRACPRQSACTKTPNKGRTVSRMENEELLDELRVRMQSNEAKALYKLRCRTVEQSFADLKEHRGLRRFHGRSLRRARSEIGSSILSHNLLKVAQRRDQHRPMPSKITNSQTLQAA